MRRRKNIESDGAKSVQNTPNHIESNCSLLVFSLPSSKSCGVLVFFVIIISVVYFLLVNRIKLSDSERDLNIDQHETKLMGSSDNADKGNKFSPPQQWIMVAKALQAAQWVNIAHYEPNYAQLVQQNQEITKILDRKRRRAAASDSFESDTTITYSEKGSIDVNRTIRFYGHLQVETPLIEDLSGAPNVTTLKGSFYYGLQDTSLRLIMFHASVTKILGWYDLVVPIMYRQFTNQQVKQSLGFSKWRSVKKLFSSFRRVPLQDSDVQEEEILFEGVITALPEKLKRVNVLEKPVIEPDKWITKFPDLVPDQKSHLKSSSISWVKLLIIDFLCVCVREEGQYHAYELNDRWVALRNENCFKINAYADVLFDIIRRGLEEKCTFPRTIWNDIMKLNQKGIFEKLRLTNELSNALLELGLPTTYGPQNFAERFVDPLIERWERLSKLLADIKNLHCESKFVLY